jgi:glutaredoxin-like protein
MFKNLEGQRIPDVTFRARSDHEWVNLTSEDIFGGKSVIIFSLPGAFTPTCSSSHISVNDAFVMNEWQRAQKADRLSFLPDGNGEFSEKMGLLVGKDDLGFGQRSWRYSMLVRNGVIEKMFIEPEEPGDPFHVSDADTMLKYLDPQGELPYDVTIFSREGCPYCAGAKGMLNEAGIEFEELVLNRDYTDRTLRAVTTNTSYPQVFVNGRLIGGSDDLATWLEANATARAA